jgi:hypothetical protein
MPSNVHRPRQITVNSLGIDSTLVQVDPNEISQELPEASIMEEETSAHNVLTTRESHHTQPKLHATSYSTNECHRLGDAELASDQIKSHFESYWPELDRLFDEAVEITNATLQQRRLPLLVRTTDEPRWESCLGLPCDDIVDDGYYGIRWKLALPPVQDCGGERSIVSEIRDMELRTALHRPFYNDSIFVEWGVGEWARLLWADTSPKQTADTIARLMRWEVMCLDCLPELKH